MLQLINDIDYNRKFCVPVTLGKVAMFTFNVLDSAAYVSLTRDQKCFTVLEVASD